MRHTRRMIKYWLVLSSLLLQEITRTYSASCEPIDIPMCKTMAYNKTRMPNLLHHSTQENAKLAIEQFEPLVNTNCSEYLLFFLCSMYAPICTVEFQTDAIPPCKTVCLNAKRGCEPIMNEHNVDWPDYLACDDLPLYDRGVCISPEAIIQEPPDSNESDGKEEEKEEEVDRGNKDKNKGGGVCKNCRKKVKATRKTYVKNKYEYAIQAVVQSFRAERQNNMVETTVNVESVIKQPPNLEIPTGEVHLWTNASCVCPELKENEEYMISGHVDSDNNRLLFLPSSLMESWKNKWTKSITKWEKKLAKSQGKGKRRGSSGGRRRKSSDTPPPTTAAPVPVEQPPETGGGGGGGGGSSGSRRNKKPAQRRRSKRRE
ncbi:secreted frizzled-related protein 3-like [Saccoglossus kowalevskii]|uniref:Secreted frizzled-related protein 3-like n=1 Tax=Saccoglossus kowalevskii TaxID=10224 RepID=A0ABM0MYH2_SACKO|nr:PREDICTED: secreted frizzled-related protein 3-like [Saccoglossus kowalevskii]